MVFDFSTSSAHPQTQTMTVEDAFSQAAALQQQGNVQEAKKIYEAIIQAAPDHAASLHNLALILMTSSPEEARSLCQRALALQPNFRDAHHSMGMCYQNAGEFKAARESYLKAIALDPDFLPTYYQLVGIRAEDKNRSLLEPLKQSLAKTNHPPIYAMRGNFAAGKIYEDLGHYDESFYHYAKGNDIAAKLWPYNRRQLEVNISQLQQYFTPEFLEARVGYEALARTGAFGLNTEQPVFVLGMPRSGTTLVEQILASHPAVCGVGEINHISRISDDGLRQAGFTPGQGIGAALQNMTPELSRQMGTTYLKAINQLAGRSAARIINKMPMNFMQIGFIALMFPYARIIHCRRNPIDTCLSIYFQCFSEGNHFSWKLDDIIFYYRQYQSMMAYWRQVVEQAGLPLQIIDVEYEQLVANSEPEIRRLIGVLGLKWHPAPLDFHQTRRQVNTASNWQVRQQMYQRSAGRWQRYAPHIQELLAAFPEAAGQNIPA